MIVEDKYVHIEGIFLGQTTASIHIRMPSELDVWIKKNKVYSEYIPKQGLKQKFILDKEYLFEANEVSLGDLIKNIK